MSDESTEDYAPQEVSVEETLQMLAERINELSQNEQLSPEERLIMYTLQRAKFALEFMSHPENDKIRGSIALAV